MVTLFTVPNRNWNGFNSFLTETTLYITMHKIQYNTMWVIKEISFQQSGLFTNRKLHESGLYT